MSTQEARQPVGPGVAVHRPDIQGRHYMVSSGHYLASLAGARMLERGGNAVDAGVAAGIALGVLLPDFVSVAGVAPIMIYRADADAITTIAGVGHWPKAASVEYFQKHCDGKIPRGVLRTVVPAAPDAWCLALRKYGTLSFREVAEPAIELCEEGFATYPLLAEHIAENIELYRRWPSNAAIFLPGGAPPKVGTLFRQTDLGRTLRRMVAQEEAARSAGREAGIAAARDEFYRGEMARRIAAFMAEQGGLLTYDDLAAYQVKEEPPVRTTYKGWDIYACGPWCQGPVLPQVLNLLEGFDLPALGYGSAKYVHVITEALKLVFADREQYYGDPAFVPVPLDGLLSKDYAKLRRELIAMSRAIQGLAPAGEPPNGRGQGSGVGGRGRAGTGTEGGDGDTTYVCAVDREGNVFSATPSDGSMNAPIVPGLGFVPSPRGVQSWAVPGHASCLAPGKRPRLTPNPAIAFKGKEVRMPFGTPGGDVQCQAMVQTFLNMVEFGMTPQEAIEAPRFATYSFPGSFAPHEVRLDELCIEGRFPGEVRDALARLGHQVTAWPEWTWRAGAMCVIAADRRRGVLVGGADPRRTAYAIGW